MTVTTIANMQAQNLTAQFHSALQAGRRILVASHINPDGDALGTQLAFGAYLEDCGKEVVLARDSAIPDKYRFLPGIEKIVPQAEVDRSLACDVALILECPSRDRLGKVAALIGDDCTLLNIDHHPDNSLTADLNWLDTKASSVGEMACEYFQAIGYQPSPDMATQLYTAILTDTGRFRFQSTGPRTFELAANLVRLGADPRMICDSIYYNAPAAIIKLTGMLLSQIDYFDEGRICVMGLTREMLAECGANLADTEGLVDYSLYTTGVEVGALLNEVDDNFTKISLRSRGNLNVAALAARLNGGGHTGAAGCSMELPLAVAKVELVKLVQEAFDAQA